jgi:hypothetical protein
MLLGFWANKKYDRVIKKGIPKKKLLKMPAII